MYNGGISVKSNETASVTESGNTNKIDFEEQERLRKMRLHAEEIDVLPEEEENNEPHIIIKILFFIVYVCLHILSFVRDATVITKKLIKETNKSIHEKDVEKQKRKYKRLIGNKKGEVIPFTLGNIIFISFWIILIGYVVYLKNTDEDIPLGYQPYK